MLNPDIIVICDTLASAYSTIKRVDAFAHASMNTLIGKLSPDPVWLGPMRKELELLSEAGAGWQQKKPAIWSPILTHFSNYSSLLSGFADVSRQAGSDKETWLHMLNSLSESLTTGATISKAAEGQFALQINNLNNIQHVFDSSLDKAWSALADEEQGMIDLATQVTALQDKLNGLEGDITSGGIASGKSFVQSAVSINYTLVTTAGASVPYLAIAGMIFTVGKTFYDLFVTDKEIHETIIKIGELRDKLSEEAQAAAMTKAIIHLISNFDKSLAYVSRQLPALSTMWLEEKTKVDGAIHAIQAGAQPDQMIELIALPASSTTWTTLSDFVSKLDRGIEQGKPVAITTSPASPVTSNSIVNVLTNNSN